MALWSCLARLDGEWAAKGGDPTGSVRGRDLVLGLRVERGGGKSAGGSDALTESVASAVGAMILEAELLAAGVEVFVAGVLCSGCEVGERGAEVLLAAALAEACLGSGA